MALTRQPLMTPPADSRELSNSRQQRRGAWGLSVIIHIVALVGLGWIYSSLPTPAPSASVRTGGIVLAQTSSNKSTEYYDEQDVTQQAKGLPAEQQRNESSLEQSAELSPASNASTATLNNIQLPGPESSQASPANVTLGDPLAESKISSRLPGDPVSEQFLREERARLQARKPVGPVGEVSLFGSEPAQGRSFVFVIDRSKSMGGKGLNALVAAQEVLVPIQCEYYALEGLGQLVGNVDLVRANLNPDLKISTIALVMYDARTNLSEQVAEEVRTFFGDKVCRQVIPRSVRLSEAPSFGQPITVFDPTCRGAVAYRQLAKEVLR